MKYEVVEGRPWHARAVCRGLGAHDLTAIQAAGISPVLGLRMLIAQSCRVRTAIVDGSPSACWGITGTMMDAEGDVWLAVGEGLRSYPHAVARVAMRELPLLTAGKRTVHAQILCGTDAALRFARFLGFDIVGRENGHNSHYVAVRRV